MDTDLGILGDWYEDHGENGELVRNLLFTFHMTYGWKNMRLNSISLTRPMKYFGYGTVNHYNWGQGHGLGYHTGSGAYYEF